MRPPAALHLRERLPPMLIVKWTPARTLQGNKGRTGHGAGDRAGSDVKRGGSSHLAQASARAA